MTRLTMIPMTVQAPFLPEIKRVTRCSPILPQVSHVHNASGVSVVSSSRGNGTRYVPWLGLSHKHGNHPCARASIIRSDQVCVF